MSRLIAQPLPLLPLRAGALLPGTVQTIPVGRPRSVSLARTLSRGDLILIAVQKDREVEDPGAGDMHPIATIGQVRRVVRTTDRTLRLIVEAKGRAELGTVDADGLFWTANGTPVEDVFDDTEPIGVLADTLRDRLPELTPFVSGGFDAFVSSVSGNEPGGLADAVASVLPLDHDDQVGILVETGVAARLRRVLVLLDEVIARGELKKKLDDDVRKGLGDAQRKALLRERMKAIQAELGEDGGGGEDLAKLKARIEALGELPEEVAETVERELGRLGSLNPQQAEYNVVRNYLDLIASLPWNTRADESLDIDAVQAALDADHYGLEEPKKRILEHLAVLKMAGTAKATILCLVGPPGVGKTSLGSSVADAMGRPFVRIALGGVRDEAEIRGHRRTYVGALPGRILNSLKKVQVRNPVILLDEIDKLGKGWMGSPEAALLEVLDPEQNHTFTDHYLELPFDLSDVLFITTANDLGGISGPLRDRLEIIEVQGYTLDEKVQIARDHLVPKELGDLAITEDLLRLDEPTLRALVKGWTREAGVRQLRRELRKVARALALRIARDAEVTPEALEVTVDTLPDLVGRQRFFDEVAERTAFPGVATGLAWTPVGGDILFIETSLMPGKGNVQITGQLGDVMQESARAALTYVRSHADALGVDARFLEESDLHIHVPAGAVPKDGPSAGVTMFTALTSLLTGRRGGAEVARRGAAPRRGGGRPGGGIKTTGRPPHAAGITRIVLPKRNERDLVDLPDSVREVIDFVFAADMKDVLDAALVDAGDVLLPEDPAGGANDGPVHAA